MCLDMISLEITEQNLWDGRREKKGEGNDLNIGAIEKTESAAERCGRRFILFSKREKSEVWLLTSSVHTLSIHVSS